MGRFMLLSLAGLIASISLPRADESQDKKPSSTQVRSDAFGDPLPAGAIARIGTIRYRVSADSPFQTTLSPDGKLLALADMNGSINLRELPAWTKSRSIKVRGANKKNAFYVGRIAFSPDSKQLVAVDQSFQQLHLIDVASGKSLKSVTLPPKRNRGEDPFLMVSRDNQSVVCWSTDYNAKPVQEFTVWDLAKDKVLDAVKVPISDRGDRFQPAVSPDGRQAALITSRQDPNGRGRQEFGIEIWNLTTGKSERKFETEMMMTRLAFSPDGQTLAACNDQSVLRLFDLATGKEKHNIRLRRASVSHLEFSSDGKALFLADFAGVIARIDPVSGDRIAEHKAPVPAGTQQLAFLPDGKVLALAQQDDALHFWEVTTGARFSPANLPTSAISDVRFSSAQELFVASSDDVVSWWNPRTAVKVRDLKLEGADNSLIEYGPGYRGYRRYRDSRGGFTLSRSGAFVLVNSQYDTASLYDAKTGKLLFEDDSANNNSGVVVFFDGDRKLASAYGKKIRLWNPRTGRDFAQIDLPVKPQDHVSSVAISSAGKYVAVSSRNDQNQNQSRFFLLDADKKSIAREWLTQNSVHPMEFSPDDQWLAVSLASHAKLLRVGQPHGDHDVDLGKPGGEVTQLTFSADGRQLACAVTRFGFGQPTRLVVCEVASQRVRLELVGHPTGVVYRLAFSPDGALLASGATDTTALVWQVGLREFANAADSKIGKESAKVAPTAAELDDWFQKLAGADAKQAFQVMIQLARAPADAIKLLESRIEPAKKPDSGGKTVPEWLGDLTSGQFVVRNRANQALQKLGAAAERELRDALPLAKDLETKRRLEDLLERIAVHVWTPEELRQARAVEVLEAIASAQARTVLTRWSGGDPAAILTAEARKALARLR